MWLFLAAAVASYCLTAAVRRLALRHGLMDQPNRRSSHTRPTPRGGGLAIVIALSRWRFCEWLALA